MLHFGTQRVAAPSMCPALMITVSPETGEDPVLLRIVYRALTAGNAATQSGKREEGRGGFLPVAVTGVGGGERYASELHFPPPPQAGEIVPAKAVC